MNKNFELKKTMILKNITIAIDGFSSTGKSTLAKQLAKHLGYIYVDKNFELNKKTIRIELDGF